MLRSQKAFGAVRGDTSVAVGGDVDISEAQTTQLLTDAHDALQPPPRRDSGRH